MGLFKNIKELFKKEKIEEKNIVKNTNEEKEDLKEEKITELYEVKQEIILLIS